MQLVLTVDTPKVAGFIAELANQRQWSDPLLREIYDEAAEMSPQKLHAGLALLPVDPGQVNYLFGRLLAAGPQELPVIRDALAPHKESFLYRLWAAVEKPETGRESQRLRAAAALATYDPDSERWGSKVQFDSIVFLSALPEKNVRVMDKHFRKDGFISCPTVVPVEVDGAKCPHSIFTHPPAESFASVSYDIDPQPDTRFVARVGIPIVSANQNDAGSLLTFEIIGDGKSVWRSRPSAKPGEIQDCAVGLPGVKQLELRVYCPGSSSSSHPVWLEPRLLMKLDQKAEVAVVNDLLAVPADQLTAWSDALRPVRFKLLGPLYEVYRSVDRPAERSSAMDIIFDYAGNQPQVHAAARAAALAAAGRGKDKPPPDDAAKAKLRRQALDWLTAELTALCKLLDSGPPQARPTVALALYGWQEESDLAGIRDQAALAKLPAEEQKAFTQFWADVAKAAEPANNAGRLEFAQVAYDQKKFAVAKRLWAEALASDRKLGDVPEFLTKATAANPKVPAADWLVLALAHAGLKETDLARKACGKAAALLKPIGTNAALRPLLREVLSAVGPNSPEATALMAAAAGEPPTALNEAIRQTPDKAAGYRARADWLVDRGLWKQAIADFAAAFRLEPDALDGMRLGILLVHTGEIDRYRTHCRAMLERWASTEKNFEADRTLKTILLVPDFKADAKQLARLAKVAVSGDKNEAWFGWYLFSKGLYDYRTGNYADALANCRESRRRFSENTGNAQAPLGFNLALEAMALHRSGDEAGAQRAWQRRSRKSGSMASASTAATGRTTG